MKTSSALLAVLTATVASACVAAGGTECIGDETACAAVIDGGGRPGGGRDAGSGPGVDGGDDSWTPPIDTSRCDERSCDEITATGQPLPDADNDGLPDCIEGFSDPDRDGDPACDDLDADDDGLLDSSESLDDPDGDGIPGFLDTDSDNDNILDLYEGTGDADSDGIPNYLDTDSDGDTWPDSVEFGREPGSEEQPIRSDGDGEPDFLDTDSDGDGLLDSLELGCPVFSERTLKDSDGDGYTDLLEYAFVLDDLTPSAMCDPSRDIRGVVDFYFELPFEGDEQHDTLEFGTDINRGDVVFNMDTTGSMGGEIDTLKRSLSGTLIPALRTEIPSVGIGVSRFDDFPCSGYGSGADVPFQLLQRVTLDDGAAQRGVNALGTHYGNDYYESGAEALYQLATGAGRNECGSWAPFNAGAGLVPGVADGTRGGAGFRDGALPIVVHITDAPMHARGEDGYPYGASRTEMTDAINNFLGGKVIGVVSGTDPRGELESLARQTGSVVPACAWDGRRPSGCGEGQCCTGQNGRGRGSEAGNCPLVFDISDNGSGLDTSIVSGIAALVNFSPITVTTRVTRDEGEFLETGIDTSLFLKSIVPVTAVGPSSPCGASFSPTPADTNGDGVLDGFINVIPGTRVFFDIGAHNDFVRSLAEPQVFIAYIDVIGNGTAVLDTLTVTILVPPASKL